MKVDLNDDVAGIGGQDNGHNDWELLMFAKANRKFQALHIGMLIIYY